MLNNFSDLAIVLLLFGVGLSFPLKQLGAIGRIGSSIAGIEVLVMLEWLCSWKRSWMIIL
jgi:CPA2 family monovalent cation:H+ antiporter-2